MTAWTPRPRAAAVPGGPLLPPGEVDRLFPAHLVADDRNTILAVGPSLRRLTGDGLVGRALSEVFEVAVGAAGEVALAASAPCRLDLRGVSLAQDGCVWLLVGHQLGCEAAPGLVAEDFGPGAVGRRALAAIRDNAELVARTDRITAALSEQKRAAEAADRAKTTFLATMSHEIRTPMNGVLGLASLLARSDLDDEQRRLLDVMIQSGHALMDILNDVLDLSKVESGRVEVERVGFALDALFTGIDAMFGPQASGKGVELVVESDAPARLTGDPSRLRQILLNLVGNAIKFTESGTVALRASYRQRAGRGGQLTVAVSDTGIGIAPGAIERVFQPFLQADSSTTRMFGGTGLGLAITRRLVELLEGSITVESRLGIGSTFTVVLPMEPASGAAPAAGPASRPPAPLPDLSAGGHRVLLVEDNQTNQFLMLRMLERLGLAADCAGNGREAIAAWEKGRYDLILMDVEMPILDGLEAAREIRRREGGLAGARVPILALSAETSQEGARAAIEAGMDRFITKPITVDSLSVAVTEALEALGARR